MGFLDFIFGVAEIADSLSDKNTYFKVTCDTLEMLMNLLTFSLIYKWLVQNQMLSTQRYLLQVR